MKIDKSIVIHQPNFLPWLGYFAKLVYAEKLVVLDSVFFSKRKHIDRVQIVGSSGDLLWIGLPVGENFKTPCNKIYFEDKSHLEKIVKTLYYSYSKAKHFKVNIEFIEETLFTSINHSNLLSEIDIYISVKLMELLNIEKPKIIKSSDYLESTFLAPTDRLIYLCEKIKSSNLIVGSIEATEIHQVKKMSNYGINILLQDYLNNHPVYFQNKRNIYGFAKGLSIIDCLFNVGVLETRSLLNINPINYGRKK